MFVRFYCATQICIARTCYGNVAGLLAGWLAGWVSVTAGIVTDGRTRCRSKYPAYYVARVKTDTDTEVGIWNTEKYRIPTIEYRKVGSVWYFIPISPIYRTNRRNKMKI